MDPDRWGGRARLVVWGWAAFEPLDDDHAAAAAGTEIYRLRLGLGCIGDDCLDGLNGNYWRHKPFAGPGDILGAFGAGERALRAGAGEGPGHHADEQAGN